MTFAQTLIVIALATISAALVYMHEYDRLVAIWTIVLFISALSSTKGY